MMQPPQGKRHFTVETEQALDAGDCYPLANKEWAIPKLPRDKDGFVKSFTADQVDEYLKFWDEFGVVVIDNVLSKTEIETTIEELWSVIEKQDAVERDDPRSWTMDKWPAGSAAGFILMDVALGKAGWANRQNPAVYEVFKEIFGKNDLWVSVDRFGVMRPTKDVPLGQLPHSQYRTNVESTDEIPKEDKPEWRSVEKWTHWDLNPWMWTLSKTEGRNYQFEDFISEYNGTKNTGALKVQGLLNLADSSENDGGFCMVPGFHHLLQEWARLTKDTSIASNNPDIIYVPTEDTLHKYLEKVTCRAGSLVIWRFRMVQYLKMFPAQEKAPGTGIRKVEVKKRIPEGFEISTLGKKLFSLESWGKHNN